MEKIKIKMETTMKLSNEKQQSSSLREATREDAYVAPPSQTSASPPPKRGRLKDPKDYCDGEPGIDEDSFVKKNSSPRSVTAVLEPSLANAQQQQQQQQQPPNGATILPYNTTSRSNSYFGSRDVEQNEKCTMYYDDILFAKMLQKDEYEKIGYEDAATEQNTEDDTDLMIAKLMQYEEYEQGAPGLPEVKELYGSSFCCSDRALAQLLQADEEITYKENLDESYMLSTNTGKAVMFVKKMMEKITEIHAATANQDDLLIESIARDDLVFLAEQLLNTQEEFAKLGKPYNIDIGYHNTSDSSLEQIRKDGLLTKKDRHANNIRAAERGAYFGDGVYTANNPFAFKGYGPVGLMVARLKGKTIDRGSERVHSEDVLQGFNTVVGNKAPGRNSNVEVVLRSSSQALPLVRFPVSVLPLRYQLDHNGSTTKMILDKYYDAMQELIDECFNQTLDFAVSQDFVFSEGLQDSSSIYEKLPVAQVVPVANSAGGSTPPRSIRNLQETPRSRSSNLSHVLPTTNNLHNNITQTEQSQHAAFTSSTTTTWRHAAGNNDLFQTFMYRAPDEIFDANILNLDSISIPKLSGKPEDCPICLCPVLSASYSKRCSSWDIGCKLNVCGHAVHVHCLSRALQSSNRCPVCRVCVSKPQGASPSGSMTVSRSSENCDGHGSIKITYVLQGGLQKAYHDNPGESYHGDRRVAYLPDSPEGNRLLPRLIFAFCHGLTFRVGTSLTTGNKNRVTWASIHHKTSCHPGPHGYPDPGYLLNCHDELNRLNVPPDPAIEELLKFR